MATLAYKITMKEHYCQDCHETEQQKKESAWLNKYRQIQTLDLKDGSRQVRSDQVSGLFSDEGLFRFLEDLKNIS